MLYSVNGGAFTSTPPPNLVIQANSNNIIVKVNGPLPVELLNFQAGIAKFGNLLAWQTASEKDFARFDVERSGDGRAFEKIGEVKARGRAASYEYLDAQPLPGAGYYRLKMIDLDGKFAYSKVVAISAQAKGFSEAAYPNPFDENLTVTVGVEKKSEVTVDLLDVLGRSVRRSVVQAENGINVSLSTAELPTGTYFLQVTDRQSVSRQKIVKR